MSTLPRILSLAGLALVLSAFGIYHHRKAAVSFAHVEKAEPISGPMSVPPAAAELQSLAASAYANPADTLCSVLPADLLPSIRRIDTPAHAGPVSLVRIHPDYALGKRSPFWRTGNGGRVLLPLPQGPALTVVIEKTISLGPDRFVSIGHVDGQPLARSIFAYNQGEMSATVAHTTQGDWQLRAVADSVSQLYPIDASQLPPCGGPVALSPAQHAKLAAYADARAQTIAALGIPAASTSTPGPVIAADALPWPREEVRVFVVYTAALASSFSPGAIRSAADLAVATMNDDLAQSQVPVTITLAGTAQVTYDESASQANAVESDALARLADPNDGYMDEVHALRDQNSADLVCLLHLRHDSASAGLAYEPTSPSDIENATEAFSVVDYAYLNGYHVFSHELAHNFGCAHDRDNAVDDSGKPTTGMYPYSYGYRFTGSDGQKYCTIMAYTKDGYSRLPYYSDPNLIAPSPINSPMGVAAGQPGEAYNALTLTQNAFMVSSFRLSTQSPSDPGKLVNVSTRAFVGTGGQQLIGGFVINGTQPKKVVLRAIGPTLSQFNVAGCLANPIMYLHRLSDSSIVASNDDWHSSDNADMTAAGAFSLPANSKDSVIVATLDPGSYTANVEGVGGTTGVALIEAYEADATSSKLINLSTRGYADTKTPMIGGFVIRADPANPGKTKRVVIRALGPSLANYGVSGAMDDPMFTLYDSNNNALLTVDDWSTGAQQVNGSYDDSKPTITTYSEKEIAAAGLAPGNRRDSAAMLDLPAGAYTVIVQPVEILPAQPASPGIALVEVYEVHTP